MPDLFGSICRPEQLLAAARHIDDSLDGLNLECDDRDELQLVVRGSHDSYRLVSVLEKLGYLYEEKGSPKFSVRLTHLLEFHRRGDGPWLEREGITLNYSLQVLFVLDAPPAYEVLAFGPKRQIVSRELYDTFATAYEAAVEIFRQGGVWGIRPDIFNSPKV